MKSTPFSTSRSAPAWSLLGLEPIRAAFEYAGMQLMDKTALPRGDGHPVVIFPGLAADERAISPLKGFCEQLGYAACDWGRGLNAGPQGDVDAWLLDLARHVRELTCEHSQPVSLIGWSLGGIYAREVAKLLGKQVRQVITVGTPFAGSVDQTNVSWLYRLVSGQAPALDEALMARLRQAPEGVPTTSIFSRSDGVVAWQACIQDADDPCLTENIEVEGSHCGLVWNAKVLAIIADRLHHGARGWEPYAPRAARLEAGFRPSLAA